jgi:signal transduction histidine kinase
MNFYKALHLELTPPDEFNPYDDYYSSISDNAYMDVITTLIEDISYPVFVIKSGSQSVVALNQAAKQGLEATVLDNVLINDLFVVKDTVLDDQPIVSFNNQWYLVNTDTFIAGDELYEKVELKLHSAVPDGITLDRWKHMIAVMLHRFRSPLTGISGYLDLLIDETEIESTRKRAEKVDEGVKHLANLMDELEHFYNIEPTFDVSKLEHVELDSMLNRVLFKLHEDSRNRIQFLKPSESRDFLATDESLERVLQLLINNALQYSAEGSPITISQLSNKYIKISNEGAPIPPEINDHVFHPFVTSKANNLGIGLTKALVYAGQFGGTIFQTENGEQGRISFTICFP